MSLGYSRVSFRSLRVARWVTVAGLLGAICAQPQQRPAQARFASIPVASGAQQNAVISTSLFWSRNGAQNISYKTMARSGDSFGQTVFGQLVDSKSQVP